MALFFALVLAIYAVWKCYRNIVAIVNNSRRLVFGSRSAAAVFIATALALPLCVVLLEIALPVGYVMSGGEAGGPPTIATKTTAKNAAAKKYPCAEPSSGNCTAIFYKSLIELAHTDSIGMVIDLPDSTLRIELFGVPLRQCRIVSFHLSPALKILAQRRGLGPWLSRPFVLATSAASLAKVPIRVRKAPRDSIEARKYASPPEPPDDRNVAMTLTFDRGLSVSITQAEGFQRRGLIFRAALYLRDQAIWALHSIRALASMHVPQPEFGISIRCSRDDARAIYRALPSRAGLALQVYR